MIEIELKDKEYKSLLIISAAGSGEDFHLRVNAHAERTTEKPAILKGSPAFINHIHFEEKPIPSSPSRHHWRFPQLKSVPVLLIVRFQMNQSQ